jgi:hypothetical protein
MSAGGTGISEGQLCNYCREPPSERVKRRTVDGNGRGWHESSSKSWPVSTFDQLRQQ